MYKHHLFLSAAMATACIVSSCRWPLDTNMPYQAPMERQKQNFFYVPASPNTRFSKEKSDLSFNVDQSSGQRYNGLHIDGGFVPTDHLGVVVGYHRARNRSDGVEAVHYDQFEIGAGYITKLQKGWHFENYLGWGKGRIENVLYSGYSSVKSNRYFIQPAFAYTNLKRSFSIGFISRFSGVKFNPVNMFLDPEREPFTAHQLNILEEKPFHTFWEPGFKVNAGWKNFRFNAAYTYSKDLTASGLEFPASNLALGVTINFNTGKKK